LHYLFERLAQAESGPVRLGGREQLQLDILRQIQCLVASRPWLEAGGPDESVNLLTFGAAAVPDHSSGNAQELARYGRRLERLIAHYEPRLEHPCVSVEPNDSLVSPFKIVVSGTLAPDEDSRSAAPARFEALPPGR
jgi:predicted component of type VI protein secretion system